MTFLWRDIPVWAVRGEFEAHESNVSCLALGQMSGRVLVTGGCDRKINLWAIGNTVPILSLNAHESTVECVKFGHTDEFVCSGSHAGDLKIWDLEANKKVRAFVGHRDGIKTLDFHPYGDFLATGSLDTTIKFWDLRRKGCLSTYKGHNLTVNRVRFSPDGIWLASAGEDGSVKIWDVRMGKGLADLHNHEAAVHTVEFHPHEFLLASGGMDKSVQFWDLENFQAVSCARQTSGPIRCLRFSPDGKCLYGGVEHKLKVFAWEPGRLLDSINTGWGCIQDLVHTGQELVGASFNKSMVSLVTVDLRSVRTKAEPAPSQPSSDAKTGFPVRSAHVRKSFSKERLPPGAFTVSSKKTINEDSERSGTETEEERTDPKKAFQASRSLNRTPPPAPPKPQPESESEEGHYSLASHYETPEPLSLSSLDSVPRVSYDANHSYSSSESSNNVTTRAISRAEGYVSPQKKYLEPEQPSRVETVVRSPSPKQTSPLVRPRRHSATDTRKPVLPDKPKMVPAARVQGRQAHHENEDFPVKMNNIRHSPSDSNLAKHTTVARRKGSLNLPDTTPLSARGPGPSAPRPTRPVLPVRPSPAASPAYYTPPQTLAKESPLNDTADQIGGLNIQDFLPKNVNSSTPYQSQNDVSLSESQAVHSLKAVHNSMMMALSGRKRNLQVIFSVWHTKEPKAAIDHAVGMNDPALMADLLGVLVLRPTIWSLDICGSVLPALENMLQSKYEAYMTIGCSALALILRNFAHIIRTNILAPVHTMGVDISREERYNKSMRCYQQLISIRAFLLKRQTMPGKLGQSYREVVILMENLES